MIHAGIGIPHEYVNRMNAGSIGTRYGLGTVIPDDLETDGAKRRAYIAALLENRTGKGVFAAKIERGQLRQYFHNYKVVEPFKVLEVLIPFILYREGLVAQAVSLLTGRWGVDDVVTTSSAINPDFFDSSLIAEIALLPRLWTSCNQDRERRLFFAKNEKASKAISPGRCGESSCPLGLVYQSENCDYAERRVSRQN